MRAGRSLIDDHSIAPISAGALDLPAVGLKKVLGREVSLTRRQADQARFPIWDTEGWNLSEESLDTSNPSLFALLVSAAERFPSRIAVTTATETVRYAELLDLARRYAGWLQNRGLGRGHRVAASAESSVDFVALLWATSLVSATLVPLNPMSTTAAQDRVVTDSNASSVIRSGPTPDRHGEISWASVADQVRTTPPYRGGELAVPGDIGLLIYTSGTTAIPAGIMCSMEQISFATAAIQDRLGYREDDVVLSFLPLTFDYGIYQVFLCAAGGASLVLRSRQLLPRIVQLMEEHHVTILPGMPQLDSILLASFSRHPATLALRLITNTGEVLSRPMQSELAAAFPSASVALMYGLTECKRVSIGVYPARLLPRDDVGCPLDGTEVRVLGIDGAIARHSQVGELVIIGPTVTDGYVGGHREGIRFTTSSTTGARMLWTGDYGRVDSEGRLYVEGRRDEIFKLRGLRVSAAEIEAAAVEISGVRAARVELDAARAPVLWIASDRSAAEIGGELLRLLEREKIPADIRIVKDLPITPHGKVARNPSAYDS